MFSYAVLVLMVFPFALSMCVSTIFARDVWQRTFKSHPPPGL